MPELIDTLWNVNSLYLFRLLKVFTELIDTLWNVNTFLSAILQENPQN